MGCIIGLKDLTQDIPSVADLLVQNHRGVAALIKNQFTGTVCQYNLLLNVHVYWNFSFANALNGFCAQVLLVMLMTECIHLVMAVIICLL